MAERQGTASRAEIDHGLSAIETTALRVRVDNLAEDVHTFRAEMRESRIAVSAEIATLGTKFDAGAKPNWQMWGVAVSAMIALGTLAYWPILRAVDRNEQAILMMANRDVSDGRELIRSTTRIDNLDRRLDAISSRLAELIRTGK